MIKSEYIAEEEVTGRYRIEHPQVSTRRTDAYQHELPNQEMKWTVR